MSQESRASARLELLKVAGKADRDALRPVKVLAAFYQLALDPETADCIPFTHWLKPLSGPAFWDELGAGSLTDGEKDARRRVVAAQQTRPFPRRRTP